MTLILRFFHPLAICASLALCPVPLLIADPGHEHGAGAEHAEHSHALKVSSVGEAWLVVDFSTTEIEKLLAGNKLTAIHDAQGRIAAALQYLAGNSPMVTGDKAKRLAPALKQAGGIADNLHVAADAENAEKAAAEFKKLQSALKLVVAQYPADALKAPADALAYQCAMKDFTGDTPGNCPKCGMKMKPVPKALLKSHSHDSNAEPTIVVSATAAQSLTVGQPVEVTVKLTTKKGGKPVTHDDLQEAHTQKIHLLIIDSSLSDYHHEHPKPGRQPGEYVFTFTPRKPGAYRIFADLLPVAEDAQEYAVADLAAPTNGESITDRTPTNSVTVEGLTYSVAFASPEFKVGQPNKGTLTIKDASGQTFKQLEPIMGTYGHFVGFGEDRTTIMHIHPLGVEPEKPTDRGEGVLELNVNAAKPGLLRLYAQVQIGGVSKFAPFTLLIKP